jgi:aldehyde dehydrogenase (NAD+)
VFPTRLIVHESVHDQIVETAVRTAASLPIGDPLDSTTVVGPVVSAGHRDRIVGMLEQAEREQVGQLRLGGHALDGDGFFVAPTIYDRVRSDASIAQQEVFGPVLSVLTFADEDEAIALANDTPYGLAAAVWTRDVKRAHRVAHAVQAGTVWINNYRVWNWLMPFGGYKDSGYGREGGLEVMQHYTQTKSVWVDLQEDPADWFGDGR